ncbi:MAG: TolC family protein [Bacteroidales bacterium]|nr:TolC family protein [Bacteroidales bacterium]
MFKIQFLYIVSTFFLLLIFSNISFSQSDVRKLTLNDAIEIARQQSPDALMAKHRFRSSYWQYRSFRASYLPSLLFTGALPSYSRSIISSYDQELGTVFSYQNENRLYGSLSLNQQIGWTGGSLSLNSDLTRLDNFIFDTTYYRSSLANITYRQPIFNYNRYKWERITEPMLYEEAKKRYIEEMEQVSVTANNYFFNLLLAQIKERIAIINQANYDTLYKIAQGRYNLGKIAENDLLQLELQYLRANANVKDVALDSENQLFRLKSYLRIKGDDAIELEIPDDMKPFFVEAARAIEEARLNSSVALSFSRRLIEAESQVARAKYDGRFDANLFASYGLDNSRQNINDLNKNPSDSRMFELGVTIPIIDWGVARGQIKMAESNQEIERTSIEQEQIDFDQEIFLRVARFNMQYDQVIIAAKADTVAQKGYDITKARYLIGKISITDLNIAQAEADNSKSNYINTLWNYWRSYYDLKRLTLYDFKINRPIQVNYRELL